jgi:phenylacetate-CoA ligase
MMFLGGLMRRIRRLIDPIPRCYGQVFAEHYALLKESEWWSEYQLEEYQNEQLRKLVSHCYNHVEYYRRVFDEYGYKPASFQNKCDLTKLPYLTKEIIRDNAKSLIATNIPAKELEYHTTGGTSGTPLGVYLERRTNAIRLAFEWRYFNWAGYSFNEKCVVLRGNVVKNFQRGIRCEYDAFRNYLVLSTFDMTKNNMARYLQRIQEFEPKAVQGYPSSLEILSDFALESGFKVNKEGNLKAVFTSSETVFPYQREKIAEAFGAPIYDLYGNTEQAGRFGECECHEGLHEFSEYGITEIDETDEDGAGEIVATTFTNYAMPLLRYRTGDCGRKALNRCRCGRGLPLIRDVQGRTKDVALLMDGTPIPLTAFFFAVHVPEMASIKRIQFIQDAPGELRALVIKGKGYREGSSEDMLKRMNDNLRIKLKIAIEFTENIELTTSGKHRFFIQRSGTKA